jgi:hypothetical protein
MARVIQVIASIACIGFALFLMFDWVETRRYERKIIGQMNCNECVDSFSFNQHPTYSWKCFCCKNGTIDNPLCDVYVISKENDTCESQDAVEDCINQIDRFKERNKQTYDEITKMFILSFTAIGFIFVISFAHYLFLKVTRSRNPDIQEEEQLSLLIGS